MNDQRSPFVLDPFVFPAETKGRFRMLIATALAFVWSLSAWFIHVPNLYTQVSRVEPEVQAALDKLRTGAPITHEDIKLVGESAVAKRVVRVTLFQIVRIGLSCAVLAIFCLATWALYYRHPTVMRQRHKTRPLTAPGAVAEIDRLAATAGLSSDLSLEYKADGLVDGVAFGQRGREVLVLAGSRLILERPWNDFTRAIALHEMGHVVNDDIRSRELSRAVWIVLPALAVLATLGVAGASVAYGEVRFPVFQPATFATDVVVEDTTHLVHTILKTTVTFFVAWWIWAGLIRAREHYADHRVSSWGFRKPLLLLLRLPGSPEPWWHCLRLATRFDENWPDCSWWDSWTKLWERYGWRRHPSKAARVHALQEPTVLFRAGPDLAFLTGLLLALLGAQLTPLSTDLTLLAGLLGAPLFLLFGPLALLLFLVLALGVTLPVTWLITGTFGVQVQREAIADLTNRPHHEWGYLRLGTTALLFALGLEVGLLVSPFGPFSTTRSPWWVLTWLLGFTLLIWMWLLYLRASTRLLLGAQAGASSPRWATRWLTGSSMFLLTVLLWPALAFRLTLEVASDDTLLHNLTRPDSTPTETFAFIAGTSLVLLCLGFVLYVGISGLSLLGMTLRFYHQRARCPRCHTETPFKRIVGRPCADCGAALAPWLFEHRKDQVQ